LKILSLLLSFMLVTGCSLMLPPTQTINIYCSEKEGQVLVNDVILDCPVDQTTVRRDKPVTVTAQKPGFIDYQKTVKAHFNSFYYLDLVGTFVWLVPFFGTLAPGAWDLDQTDFYINLYPSNSDESSNLIDYDVYQINDEKV
jgi:hypothetical protein